MIIEEVTFLYILEPTTTTFTSSALAAAFATGCAVTGILCQAFSKSPKVKEHID